MTLFVCQWFGSNRDTAAYVEYGTLLKKGSFCPILCVEVGVVRCNGDLSWISRSMPIRLGRIKSLCVV